MDAALEREVWNRAGDCCEYCHVPASAYKTPFQIDHVIALKHGGITVSENLALSCFHCNQHKGPNIAGIDPQTSSMIQLFHPRRDRWLDHFQILSNGQLLARSAIGRVTIAVLNINNPAAVSSRAWLIAEGLLRIDDET
ncbi:MAG TPA: HNH endonuclease signature motif containing protein [Tepidisphaeraceae bacterium]|nr:HNH endonuclease signature motif containing protein [Tepidisphaeraceae bacterium]